ncbi:MAG: putative DNA binding domain-containing protein, partial [Neisseriaceae bacterium]|nr:putative DNA binding domain-containing protein [Neisseriaceae bacterium]
MNNIISKTNSIITKSYLQEQPENQYFECKGIKGEKIKPVRIADELIGMLNAGGGILVLGIEDNREISDLNTLTEEELSQYRTLVVNFIKPSCNIKLEELIVDNKLIFVFHVEPDYERIFSRKDTEDVFLRVADTNKKLNREQVRKLEYDKNIRKFEDETIDNFLIEDLDNELLNKYKSTINYEGDNFELLYKRYLLEKRDNQYYFKKSAILLFAKYPEKYIPNASVRYIRYQGSELKTGEEHNVIKDERFEDNIPNLIIKLHN